MSKKKKNLAQVASLVYYLNHVRKKKNTNFTKSLPQYRKRAMLTKSKLNKDTQERDYFL